MVFGSPKQRATTGGMTREEATKRWLDGLAFVAPLAAERRVTILVEALPSDQCDIVNTLEEAASMVREIGLPSVQTMFDTHNAAEETDPHAAVVDRYFDLIRHVHVNEMDGRHPGTGDYDFKPVLNVLRRQDYQGWVSLEVFDFSAGAENIASQMLALSRKRKSGNSPHEPVRGDRRRRVHRLGVVRALLGEADAEVAVIDNLLSGEEREPGRCLPTGLRLQRDRHSVLRGGGARGTGSRRRVSPGGDSVGAAIDRRARAFA